VSNLPTIMKISAPEHDQRTRMMLAVQMVWP